MKHSPLPVRRPSVRTQPTAMLDLTAVEAHQAHQAHQADQAAPPASLDEVLAWLHTLES